MKPIKAGIRGRPAMTVDVPIDVPDDVMAEYERVAKECGADVEMVIGMDVQSVAAQFFDGIMDEIERASIESVEEVK